MSKMEYCLIGAIVGVLVITAWLLTGHLPADGIGYR
jgi:hypothetical protein